MQGMPGKVRWQAGNAALLWSLIQNLNLVAAQGDHASDICLQVRYMAFSAHTDAKGILRLVAAAAPRNVLLVHGEKQGMDFMANRIQRCTRWLVSLAVPAGKQHVAESLDSSM
jgi:integrator complex subunit 11